MSEFEIPNHQREFRCDHCHGKILIPRELPPTTGPCPHCGGVITSPAEELPVAPPARPAAPVTPLPVSIPPPPAPALRPTPPVERPAPPVERPTPPVERPTPPVEKPAQPASLPPKDDTPIHLPRLEEIAKRRVNSREQVSTPKRSRLIPILLLFLLLVCTGAVVTYFVWQEIRKSAEAMPPVNSVAGDPVAKEANYIRIGWQHEARRVLDGYMAATRSEGKLPFVLHADRLAETIDDFYGGGSILDSDTPAEAFSVYELSEEDRKRGLFMMIYDQPPQFEMSEFFRPLASLEVQYGLDQADLLLSTLALVGNFAMEPLRVHAFFKRTGEGLKLDWEIFAQTKYRTFQTFVELPEPGQTETFRVFIVEDVPEKGRAVAGTRTYRLVDPAHTEDSARVNVKIDSAQGRTLAPINWRGAEEGRPITRTATVKLKWTGQADAPGLELHRFICWEFLGLGGEDLPEIVSEK